MFDDAAMEAASWQGTRPALTGGGRGGGDRYDPWLDLRRNWPGIRIVVEPMPDDLLGELRLDEAAIALRAGTSAAQSRCTLAHEIIHLERGIRDCGPWLQREERMVHGIAARRLIRIDDLIDAIRHLGGTADRAAMAQILEVDNETLLLRLTELNRLEHRAVRRALAGCSILWSVA